MNNGKDDDLIHRIHKEEDILYCLALKSATSLPTFPSLMMASCNKPCLNLTYCIKIMNYSEEIISN